MRKRDVERLERELADAVFNLSESRSLVARLECENRDLRDRAECGQDCPRRCWVRPEVHAAVLRELEYELTTARIGVDA